MSDKVTEIRLADPKAPPDLDRWAKKLADYAIPRAMRKGFTIGQLASVFINLAAELAIMCRADEMLFLDTSARAFTHATARSVSNEVPQKIVVEMLPPKNGTLAGGKLEAVEDGASKEKNERLN